MKIISRFPYRHRTFVTAEITMESGEWLELLEKMNEAEVNITLVEMLMETVGESISGLGEEKQKDTEVKSDIKGDNDE